jgi:hypothetical protein
MYILYVYAIMAPAHESETIVFNFRKLLSTLPNYAELEQILLLSVNWGKQVCNMWKVAIHRYSCLLKEKHSIYIKFTSFKL